jgi:hypothetical protein
MAEYLKGTRELKARLLRFVRIGIPDEFSSALYQEALLVEKVSRERTPVLTGALRASHETSEPFREEDTLSCEISVGGPAAPYAVWVHEKVEIHHKVGQAKFLESAVLEAGPGLPARIANRVALERAAR